ncbi:hypothetical protein V6N13_053771 [Hibiscus sabdariffa]
MISGERRQKREGNTGLRVGSKLESKGSVNGDRRTRYRQVAGVEDEEKRAVLQSCAMAWCKGSLREASLVTEFKHAGVMDCSIMRIAGAMFLLMFVNEEERRLVLERTDLDRWFTRVEAWQPELQIESRSAWLSVVGLPMHLWSEGTFNSIARLWGKLVRVEAATTEPRSFERARILIETGCLDRVEETIEMIWGEWSGHVRVQEVEVIHSHDVVCHCEDTESSVSSEADEGDGSVPNVVRDNLMYISVKENLPLGETTGSGYWDEQVGMADRGMLPDHFDALWCEPALGQPVANQVLRLPMVPDLGHAGSSGPLAVLELEWDSQQDRIFEPSHSNFDFNLDNGNLLPTDLTYTEDDLVPVP